MNNRLKIILLILAILLVSTLLIFPLSIYGNNTPDLSKYCSKSISVTEEQTQWSYTTPCGNNIIYVFFNIPSVPTSGYIANNLDTIYYKTEGLGTPTATVTEKTYQITEIIWYYNCCPSAPAEPEPWIRDTEMKWLQVWINEDNMFQFSFIYPYADNNWVRIYDSQGNMIYEIDMPYDNPNIIVDLPDGMYTVKTFNVDPSTPIQTFVIGK